MMDNKLFQDFVDKMFTLDIDQYNKLNQTIRALRDVQVIKVKNALEVGDRVKITGGKRLTNAMGKVLKINRVKALVLIDNDNRTWNIPLAMIAKI
jgi:ribosome maturation factor RimP